MAPAVPATATAVAGAEGKDEASTAAGEPGGGGLGAPEVALTAPKPSLVPFVLEALAAQSEELSVLQEGVFLLMHMAEDATAIKTIFKLGGLEQVS